MKLTPEFKKLFKESAKYSTPKDMWTLAYWDIFCPKKRNKFVLNLKRGMSWRSSINDAKRSK